MIGLLGAVLNPKPWDGGVSVAAAGVEALETVEDG